MRVGLATAVLASLVSQSAAAETPGVLLQPGIRLVNPANGYPCTMGFVLKDTAGRRYAIVGYFCATKQGQVSVSVDPPDVETTWRDGRGPVIVDVQKRVAGRLVYAFDGTELDVALMRIETKRRYSSRVLQFGGPRGIDTSISSDLTLVNVYGGHAELSEGTVYYTAGQDREDKQVHGYTDVLPQGLSDPELLHGLHTNDASNSGAPVVAATDSSPAIGVMGVSYGGAWGNSIFRLQPLLDRFGAKLHTRFMLVSAGYN